MAFVRGAALVGLLVGVVGSASAETIAYSYDAQGRLMHVVHSGGVNNGQQVAYTLDAAGNRVRVQVSGAP